MSYTYNQDDVLYLIKRITNTQTSDNWSHNCHNIFEEMLWNTGNCQSLWFLLGKKCVPGQLSEIFYRSGPMLNTTLTIWSRILVLTEHLPIFFILQSFFFTCVNSSSIFATIALTTGYIRNVICVCQLILVPNPRNIQCSECSFTW